MNFIDTADVYRAGKREVTMRPRGQARPPAQPVFLAWTPVRTVLIWAPTSGHIGMSESIFSYRGEVTVGLMVDASLIPDPIGSSPIWNGS